MERIEFIMRGRTYTLTDEQVNAAMKGQTPGPIREYAVPVNGKLYSVRQVFASAIREPQGLVNTQVAARQLRRLGYQVQSVRSAYPGSAISNEPPEHAPTLDPALAEKALELAVEATKGTDRSPDDVVAAARAFLEFLEGAAGDSQVAA